MRKTVTKSKRVAFAAQFLILVTSLVSCQTVLPPLAEKNTPDFVAQDAAFEVATIKPINPEVRSKIGYTSYAGGKVAIGRTTVKTLIGYAYDVEERDISGGPAWAGTDRFDIVAMKPESLSPVRIAADQSQPTDDERGMLRSLLSTRFGLHLRKTIQEGNVYLLTRGSGKLKLDKTTKPTSSPRGGVLVRVGGVADGEAFGTNISMSFLAKQLAFDLERPVLDRTDLPGSFDFHVPAFDPTNTDVTTAIIGAMERLGLKLKTGKAPIQTFVIVDVVKPDEN